MNLFMLIKVVVRALSTNKIRSALTCFGIMVGIAAVIAVMSIGSGASLMMEKEIAAMGSNLLMVLPEKNRKGAVHAGLGSGLNMTVGDYIAIKRDLSHVIAAVSPTINASVQLIRGNKNWNVKVNGVSADYPMIRNWEIARGRFFSEEEVGVNMRVCVIGETVRQNLFNDDEDCIGEIIRVGQMPFRVVGILKPKGANGIGHDQDDTVLAPYTAVRSTLLKLKFMSINMMNISLYSLADMEECKREIRALLRQRHNLKDFEDDDFEFRDTLEIMNTMGAVTSLVSIMLSVIASISLVVGGVGIMNIMLVSITERTKEIGLRMAVGATPLCILSQFLIEAMSLSILGGVGGIIMGVGVAKGIGVVNHWPIQIDASCVLLALTVSSFIGIFFGFYPAFRASRLTPIDCLRYE